MSESTPTIAQIAQTNSVIHHSLFGHRGQASATRTKYTDWQTKPFQKPITSQWRLVISKDDLPKLLNGVKPEQMEDKWFVYADGPNDEGEVRIHFHRSWTGFKVAEVKIVIDQKQKGKDGVGNVFFEEIIWESEKKRVNQDEVDAKEMVINVAEWCMDAVSPARVFRPEKEE